MKDVKIVTSGSMNVVISVVLQHVSWRKAGRLNMKWLITLLTLKSNLCSIIKKGRQTKKKTPTQEVSDKYAQ